MIIMAGVGEDRASSSCMPDPDRFIDAARYLPSGDQLRPLTGPGAGEKGDNISCLRGERKLHLAVQ